MNAEKNPLINRKKPWCVVRFTEDGKAREFYSVVNSQTGCRLTAFDSNPPAIGNSLAWVREMVAILRERFPEAVTLGTIKGKARK
jgi:hypothetical protein